MRGSKLQIWFCTTLFKPSSTSIYKSACPNVPNKKREVEPPCARCIFDANFRDLPPAAPLAEFNSLRLAEFNSLQNCCSLPAGPRCGLLSKSVAILVQVVDAAHFFFRVAVERLVLDTECWCVCGARLMQRGARSRSPRNPYVHPAALGPRPPVEQPSLTARLAQLQEHTPEDIGAFPLLPKRAIYYFQELQRFRNAQASYVNRLIETQKYYMDAATDDEREELTDLLVREYRKLLLLDCRTEIYTTIAAQIQQVPFNEVFLNFDEHIRKNEPYVVRAILTFRQAATLVDHIMLHEIATQKKLIVDIEEITSWNHTKGCYLEMDVFKKGSRDVESMTFCHRYLQIKYLEASWPGAPVTHRIQPLAGSMNAFTSKKKTRAYDIPYDVQKCREYKSMIVNLMEMLQRYVELCDDSDHTAARSSVELVRDNEVYKTLKREERDDSRMCVWLEEVWGWV